MTISHDHSCLISKVKVFGKSGFILTLRLNVFQRLCIFGLYAAIQMLLLLL